MKCPNTGRKIRRGQEVTKIEGKVQNGRVPDLQVEIHRLRRETPGAKEAVSLMKCQCVRIIRRNIGGHVAWEVEFVMGAAKRGTKSKIAQRGIEHKDRVLQFRLQYSSLRPEGGIINRGKEEHLHLYRETPQLLIQLCQVYSLFVVNLHTSLLTPILHKIGRAHV